MADLEFLLRKAVKSGLNYLSLSPNHTNPKDGPWVGCYRHVETNICQYITADDPVEAVEKAIRAGEADVKRQRAFRTETLEPMRENIDKIQKKNIASVRAREEEKEAEKAKVRKRREADDLI